MKALTKAPKILLTATVLAALLGACRREEPVTDTTVTAPDVSATAPGSTVGATGTVGDTGTGTEVVPVVPVVPADPATQATPATGTEMGTTPATGTEMGTTPATDAGATGTVGTERR